MLSRLSLKQQSPFCQHAAAATKKSLKHILPASVTARKCTKDNPAILFGKIDADMYRISERHNMNVQRSSFFFFFSKNRGLKVMCSSFLQLNYLPTSLSYTLCTPFCFCSNSLERSFSAGSPTTSKSMCSPRSIQAYTFEASLSAYGRKRKRRTERKDAKDGEKRKKREGRRIGLVARPLSLPFPLLSSVFPSVLLLCLCQVRRRLSRVLLHRSNV